MTGRLIGYDGREYALPALLEWTLNYGTGTPCDSFEVRCPWGSGLDGALSDAVEFVAQEDGETVFRGVVDEYEWSCGSGGSTLLVSGRGMAGRLLDNEAEPADYQTATLGDILRDHVTPYGIQTAEGASLPAVPSFSVESGSSEWQVLYNFARYYGGVEPSFDRQGILHLTPWQDGKRLVLDNSAAVEEIRWTERRYGVLSEVLVRDRTTQSVQRVVNQSVLDRGGMCRRVLTMPGRSSYQAMRYSGRFQLEQSAAQRLRLELTLAGRAEAWPGDLAELNLERYGLSGVWRVLSTGHSGGGQGLRTTLELGEREITV